jgi:hypothetical protein
MRRLLEGMMLAAVTLLVAGAAVAWTFRASLTPTTEPPAVRKPVLSSAAAVRPQTPATVTTPAGPLDESELRKLQEPLPSTASDADAVRAEITSRLGAVSNGLRALDQSYEIPAVTSRAGTARTGRSAAGSAAAKPVPPADGTDATDRRDRPQR